MPPVGAAIAAVAGSISATLAAGGIGAALLQMGGSMLLSVAAQALMPGPKVADRTVSLRAPVAPRDLIYGRARKGGVIVFLHGSGNKNQHLHLVMVLAAHQVKSIGAIYFDGEEAVDAAGVAQGRWSGRVATEKRLGAADQTAFAGLVSALPDKWTTEHRLRGCAAIYLRLTYNQDAFPGGIPNITVDIEGKDDILDPRTGVRGYTENAALCLADYMSLNLYGIGAQIGAEDGIASDDLIEAANICDEAVPLAGGGSEPRYSCNGTITVSETPKTVIEGLLSAMAGRAAYQSGAWHLHAGAYRIPDVALGPGDIREGGLALTTRVSMAQNHNAVRGQFVSPENDWQPDDFPAYESATYLAEDGGERRYRDIVLPFTISASMAQRLAKIELERARRQMSLRAAGKLGAWRAAVGEVVTLDYARWGMVAKPFEVHGMTLDLAGGEAPQLLPELVLRETSPLVYDWDASEQQIYAAAPRTALPSAFDIAAPGVPDVTEEIYATRDGTGVKVLARLTWAEARTEFVAQYQIEARQVGGIWRDYGRTDGTLFEIRDIDPGLWEFRIKALSVLGVSSEWRSRTQEILGLTAPPVKLQGLTIQTAGGLAILKWQASEDLDVRIGGRIKIRHSGADSPAWANSVSMDEVAGADAVAVVPLKPGSYLLRARDNSGNLGPVATVATKGAQALAFASISSLVADPGFTGSKTNLTVSGAGLFLSNVSAEGHYQFAAGFDFGAVTPVRLRSDIEITALELAGTIDDRHDPIDSWLDFDGTDGADVDVVVEARFTDDNPTGAPIWSDWSRLDSNEVAARAVQCRARLVSRSEDFNVLVSRLRIHADEVA